MRRLRGHKSKFLAELRTIRVLVCESPTSTAEALEAGPLSLRYLPSSPGREDGAHSGSVHF